MSRSLPRRLRHRLPVLIAVALALGLALAPAPPALAAPLADPSPGPPVVGQADGCAPPRRAPPPAAPAQPAPTVPEPSEPDPANPLAHAAQQLVGGFLIDLLAPVPALVRQHLNSQFNILTQTCRRHRARAPSGRERCPRRPGRVPPPAASRRSGWPAPPSLIASPRKSGPLPRRHRAETEVGRCLRRCRRTSSGRAGATSPRP